MHGNMAISVWMSRSWPCAPVADYWQASCVALGVAASFTFVTGEGVRRPAICARVIFPPAGTIVWASAGPPSISASVKKSSTPSHRWGWQASLAAIEQLSAKGSDRREALTRQLQQLEYEAHRAFDQYNQVDPTNRLVAEVLEQRWNEKLEALTELETETR